MIKVIVSLALKKNYIFMDSDWIDAANGLKVW